MPATPMVLTTGVVYVRSFTGTLSGGTLNVNSVVLDEANDDITLDRVAANTLRLASGDVLRLATDGVSGGLQLGASGDIQLYRAAASVLGITEGDSIRFDGDVTTGQLQWGVTPDVILFRGAANRLDLASGDSFSLVAGGLGVGVVETTSGRVTAAGAIVSSATGGGIGYAAGAGGAVTQTTSRTTAVTLNNISGAITTDTTSLAAGAEAAFTVNNTAVAVGDVIVLSARSGQTAGTSVPVVTAVAAGSFNITLTNLHATTADTGAMIINFAVIKAVSA